MSSDNQSSAVAHVIAQPEMSMQEQGDAGLWVSGPINGRFIVIGVSGRLSRPDDEIEAAKLDAARKVSMYQGIQGSVELLNTSGSGGFFDYSVESKIDLNYNTNYESFVSNLSFDSEKDVIRLDGATYVRFIYSAISPNINYTPEKISGRPQWANNRNLPEFSGYTTAVGYAGRRARLRDTIHASCESAIARLIESASTQVKARDRTQTGSGSSTTIHSSSEGSLSNFQILAFYIDPNTEAVYTLAIARISN